VSFGAVLHMLMTTFGGYAVAIGYFHGVNMVRVYKSWHNTSKKKKKPRKNQRSFLSLCCMPRVSWISHIFLLFLSSSLKVLAPDPAEDVHWTEGHRLVALVRAAGPRLELEQAARLQREAKSAEETSASL